MSKKEEDINEYENDNENNIASIIKYIAWVELVFGCIVSILSGKTMNEYNFNILITDLIIFGGIFIGLYALSEIIQILHDIRFELRKKNK